MKWNRIEQVLDLFSRSSAHWPLCNWKPSSCGVIVVWTYLYCFYWNRLVNDPLSTWCFIYSTYWLIMHNLCFLCSACTIYIVTSNWIWIYSIPYTERWWSELLRLLSTPFLFFCLFCLFFSVPCPSWVGGITVIYSDVLISQ